MLLCLAANARRILPLAMAAALTAAACGGGIAGPPDFAVELFDGGKFRLSEQYADNVVVINFWYPSCPPCREEMPEFQRAWRELQGEEVRFLGLFVPRGLDTEPTARAFVAELGLTFAFATDRGETIAAAYGVDFYPTTWFIAPGGRTAETWVSALDADRIIGLARGLR